MRDTVWRISAAKAQTQYEQFLPPPWETKTDTGRKKCYPLEQKHGIHIIKERHGDEYLPSPRESKTDMGITRRVSDKYRKRNKIIKTQCRNPPTCTVCDRLHNPTFDLKKTSASVLPLCLVIAVPHWFQEELCIKAITWEGPHINDACVFFVILVLFFDFRLRSGTIILTSEID
jgi:hypothetical protein